jgi:hypothetical protein
MFTERQLKTVWKVFIGYYGQFPRQDEIEAIYKHDYEKFLQAKARGVCKTYVEFFGDPDDDLQTILCELQLNLHMYDAIQEYYYG